MREVEFVYLEVLNATEQLMIFSTKFNKKDYAVDLILNIILSVEAQDRLISDTVEIIQNMNRKDAKDATKA